MVKLVEKTQYTKKIHGIRHGGPPKGRPSAATGNGPLGGGHSGPPYGKLQMRIP
jgi:hypothetical protein